jgi:hypothetical protein
MRRTYRTLNDYEMQHNAEVGLFTKPSNTNQLPNKGLGMAKKKTTKNSLGVDKSLVAMFLKMSPEERLQANDNAARTIQELRDAYKQQRNDRSGPKRNT